MKYFGFSILFLFFHYTFAQSVPAADTVFDTILERVHNEQLKKVHDVQWLDGMVKTDLADLNIETGKWEALDYTDHKRIGVSWLPVLEKMRRMTVAYTHPQSTYYQTDYLWKAINKSLAFFTNHHPLPYCDNWYQQGVTRPQSLTQSLINMRFGARELEPAVIESAVNAMCIDTAVTSNGRNNPMHKYNFGANKALIAKGWVWMGALLADQDMLETGVKEVYAPIAYTTGEGIQYDLSYDMHYGYLYNGAYGVDFMKSVIQTAWYTKGTAYALKGDKLKLFRRFICESIFDLIRGQWIDWNVLGRGIARPNAIRKDYGDLLQKLMVIDAENQKQYKQIAQRMAGGQPVDADVKPGHRHYWHTDYTVHIRPAYTLSVHAVSSRNFAQEIGNKENLKGYWGAQGTMNLQVRGDEYYNIFPWWDWTRLPGTTLPDTVPVMADKAPGSGDRRGTHVFSGGVSDSLYGVTAYVVDNDMQTTVKKAWFMFDDEIVCLGTGLSSTLPVGINTTLNQALLSDEGVHWQSWHNKTINHLPEQGKVRDNIHWVWHDHIGYVFPYRQNAVLLAENRRQSWEAIRGSGDSEIGNIADKSLFQLSVEHGVHPTHAKYAYIILPGVGESQEMRRFLRKNPISIVSNTEALQAVYHQKLKIWQLVFYKGDTHYKDEQVALWTDVPATVMLKKINNTIYQLHVADPTQRQTKITVSMKLGNKSEVQTFSIDMPQKPYAGQSRSVQVYVR